MQKPLLFDIQNPSPNESDETKIAKNLEEIKKIFTDFLGNNFTYIDWMSLRDYLRNKKSISQFELEEIEKKKKN